MKIRLHMGNLGNDLDSAERITTKNQVLHIKGSDWQHITEVQNLEAPWQKREHSFGVNTWHDILSKFIFDANTF